MSRLQGEGREYIFYVLWSRFIYSQGRMDERSFIRRQNISRILRQTKIDDYYYDYYYDQ